MRRIFLSVILGVVFGSGAIEAAAQTNSYKQTNLVSDVAGMANNTDPKLINPWGISFIPGQPFWISDNNSGFSTVYDANGVSQLPITVPPPTGSNGVSTPTGTVANTNAGFRVLGVSSQFLFATEDGTVSGWNGTGNAIQAIDHSTGGAVYKGLAIMTPDCCAAFLAVANFHSGMVETYDLDFSLLAPPGSFTDPSLPAGYAPFNIQAIGNRAFVTYAVQDRAKHDPVNAAGNGIIDIFNLDGTFVKRFASSGPLNSPWGVVQASPNFGQFSNDILVGNFGDGTINAFDPATGSFLGALKDQTGTTIVNRSLWGLVFGAGGTGNPDTLYFTAGLANESHGLFGSLVASAGGDPDFSLSATPQSGTVMAGGSMNFMLKVTPANGFDSQVMFSCAPATGITCSFNPPNVTPQGGSATSTVTITTSAGVQHYGPTGMMAMAFAGIGLFTCFVLAAPRESAEGKRNRGSLLLCGFAGLLVFGTVLASTACGGYSGGNTMNRGTAQVMVTAQSGAVSHTTMISLTVQ